MIAARNCGAGGGFKTLSISIYVSISPRWRLGHLWRWQQPPQWGRDDHFHRIGIDEVEHINEEEPRAGENCVAHMCICVCRGKDADVKRP